MEKEELFELAAEMASPDSGLEIKDRRYFLTTYRDVFVGTQAVDWFVKYKGCTRTSALVVGNELLRAGLLVHCVDVTKPFIDGYYFYLFTDQVKRLRGKLRSSGSIPTTPKGIALKMADRVSGVEVKDRKYRLKTYAKCFVASDAVDWMLKNMSCRTRDQATRIGEKLVDEGFLEHVCEPQPFQDAYLFFRFTRYVKNDPESSPTPEDENISPEDFTQLKVLGEGGYGKVVLVRKKDTGAVYAMKIVQKSRIQSEKALEHIITEKRVLINDCPFLLHLYFSFQTSTSLYLVTDFLSGGDMFFHLSRKNGRGFSVNVARFFCAELVLALEYLHQCGVVYRDLKLENVLLDAQGHVCLADFGLAKLLSEEDRTQTFCGSQGYLAPEILKGESYSYSVDWFSLGVILFEMISGVNPFLGSNFRETCDNIVHRPLRFPGTFPRSAAQFVAKLLQRDPQKRFNTAAEIKRHPWFKNLKWHKLAVKKIDPPFRLSVATAESTEHFDKLFTRMSITSEDDERGSEDALDGTAFDDFDFVALSSPSDSFDSARSK